MTLADFGILLGGIGLFLLGMAMMTDGLKLAAGDALRRLLHDWTSSSPRGLITGIAITAAVQSSSAVTVAIIGFVNANLLTLRQAMWVVFGANVGTTTTGWIVVLVGIKLDVGFLALPLVGIGALLSVFSGESSRRSGIGRALAGFGLFFLGIDALQSALAGLPTLLAGSDLVAETGWLSYLTFAAVGFALTLATQSSSAAIAIVLTASASGGLPLPLAAAAVIGTNIGTTSTAILVALNATPAAKRVAASHVLFNVITAIPAFVLLIPLASLSQSLAGLFADSGDLPTSLAVFHTLFKCLGVALVWPMASRLADFLQTLFVSPVERLATPAHLDDTLIAVPSVAVDGLVLELTRMTDMAFDVVRRRSETPYPSASLRQKRDAVLELGKQIRGYLSKLGAQPLPGSVVAALPDLIRAIQHLEDLAVESEKLRVLSPGAPPMLDGHWRELLAALHESLAPVSTPSDSADIESSLDDLSRRADAAYQRAKSDLLHTAAASLHRAHEMESALDRAETIWRCADLAIRARRRLSRLTTAKDASYAPPTAAA